MKKTLKRIAMCLIILSVFVLLNSNVFAFLKDSMKWFGEGNSDLTMYSAMSTIIRPLESYIEIIGTLVITIATIVLGLRYIFASAEGKSLAKENAISLLVACVLFFGWAYIANMLFDKNSMTFILTPSNSQISQLTERDLTQVVATKIFMVFKLIAQIVAIIGIFYVGIKYIFSGAQGRADLKGKSFPLIIGIILTFSAFEILNIVSNIIIESAQ